jgi:hypothetical protein
LASWFRGRRKAGFERSRSYQSREDGQEFVHVSVEQVVRDALTGLEADRPLVSPGRPMKIDMLLVRITPIPFFKRLLLLGAKLGDNGES